jgi:hypothetical protein
MVQMLALRPDLLQPFLSQVGGQDGDGNHGTAAQMGWTQSPESSVRRGREVGQAVGDDQA